MATALVLRERLETTLAKAQELRPIFEKLVTKAKQDVLHNRRAVHHYLKDKGATIKLFVEIAPRLNGRPGGYTRIVKSGFRAGDAAPLAVIEVLKDSGTKKPQKKPRAAKQKKSAESVTVAANEAAPIEGAGAERSAQEIEQSAKAP